MPRTGQEGVAAIEREMGLGKLDQALPVIDAVAGIADVEILATAAERYAVPRRFSPRFLTAYRLQSSVPHDPLLAAIDLLAPGEMRAVIGPTAPAGLP